MPRIEAAPGRARAWAVHLLTALGAALGAAALAAVARGREDLALRLLGAALVLDGIDGPLARAADVRRVLPEIDGSRIDDLVDYLNYVVVPSQLLLVPDLLPAGTGIAAAAFVCLTSAFQFAHGSAKTDDQLFRGFPSYWNVVAVYLLVLRFDPWVALAVVAACGSAAFAPLYFAHPLRTLRYRALTIPLTVGWAIAMATLVVAYPTRLVLVAWASIAFVVYYVGLSLALTFARRGGR
jgi:phosphatidylcholine synthase